MKNIKSLRIYITLNLCKKTLSKKVSKVFVQEYELCVFIFYVKPTYILLETSKHNFINMQM